MGEKNDPQTHTPAYKIFHYYIPCQIPAAYAFERQNEAMGTPVYESQGMADQAAAQMVSRQHTVAELVEYYNRGAQIIFEKPYDAVRVYDWLRDHLNELRSHFRYSVNTKNTPVADIQAMDDFASMVYRIARRFGGVDETQSKMSRKLEDMFASRLRHRFVPEEEKTPEQRAEESKEPVDKPVTEHPSMVDDIKPSILNKRYPDD